MKNECKSVFQLHFERKQNSTFLKQNFFKQTSTHKRSIFFHTFTRDTRLHVFKIKFQAILKAGLSSSEKDDFICFSEISLK